MPAVESRVDAESAGARSAAYAMHKIFCQLGQVIVDDVGDVIHMNAARGDVGGDQHSRTPLLEVAQRRVPLGLAAVAVNHAGIESIANQFLSQPLGAALGAGED